MRQQVKPGRRWLQPLLVLLTAGMAAVCGCASQASAVRAFESGNYEAAAEELRELAGNGDKNFALYGADYGIVLMYMGRLERARQVLQGTSQVMTTPGGGEMRGWGSLVVHESLKRFKGASFEKAMVEFYVGVTSWLLGDLETLMVAMRRTLLADETSGQEFGDDFAPAHFLYGLAARVRGDTDTFRIGLEKASARWPDNPYLKLEVARRANLVVLLEAGQGPARVRTGWMSSFSQFVPVRSPWSGAAVAVDEQPPQPAAQVLDLYYQARTRSGSPTEVVQGVKAGARTAALGVAAVSNDWRVQLPALLFGLLYPSHADVRQVELLPASMLIWSGEVAPGTHRVRATFQGAATYHIEWREVQVYPNGITLLFGRAGHGPVAKRAAAAQEEMENEKDKEDRRD